MEPRPPINGQPWTLDRKTKRDILCTLREAHDNALLAIGYTIIASLFSAFSAQVVYFAYSRQQPDRESWMWFLVAVCILLWLISGAVVWHWRSKRPKAEGLKPELQSITKREQQERSLWSTAAESSLPPRR